MNILILSLEPTIEILLRSTLVVDGYSVTTTTNSDEVIRIIGDSSDAFLLFADNFHLNPEAQQAFMVLRDRPELRNRVKIVGISAMRLGMHQWITDRLIDAHLTLPYMADQLFSIVKACGDPVDVVDPTC